MSDQLSIPLLLAALAGFGALVYLGILRARRRREALRGLSTRLGLAFDPGKDRTLHRDYGHGFFRKGHSRAGTNSIFGTRTVAGYAVRLRMGDFRWVTGSGKHRQTHHRSYAVFQLPFVGTPDLAVRREGLHHKLAGGLGFDDIDFESEEFSRTFWVKSDDRRYAYDVIHPQMMEFLLEGPTPSMEIVDDVCLVLEGTGRWAPETFLGAVGWFEAFLERWPDHLVERLRPRPRTARRRSA